MFLGLGVRMLVCMVLVGLCFGVGCVYAVFHVRCGFCLCVFWVGCAFGGVVCSGWFLFVCFLSWVCI